MKYTLTNDQFTFITEQVVNRFKSIATDVYISGSRAKETNHQFSDLDLLLKSKPSNEETVRKLKSEIEEFLENSNFPYKVDIVLESDLAASYIDDVNSSAKLWGKI